MKNCSHRQMWTRFIFRCRPVCAKNGSSARRQRASMSSAKNRARVNAAELEEMISACKKNRVQFMDGVMFMHNPRLDQSPQSFGRWQKRRPDQAHLVRSSVFTRSEDFFADNIRVNGALEPAGCLGDLGWYCIRFALWTMNWQMPHDVSRHKFFRSRKTATVARARRWNFPANCFSTAAFPPVFTARFSPQYQQWVHVSGAERLSARAGFCPSVRQSRTGV